MVGVVELVEISSSRWEASFTTTAPPARVWDAVADLRRHADWEDALVEVELVGGSPGQRGAVYRKWYDGPPTGRFRQMLGGRRPVTCTVGEVDPGRRMAWEQSWMQTSAESLDVHDFELRLDAAGDGTHVTLAYRLRRLEQDASMQMIKGLDTIMSAARERSGHERLSNWPADALGRALGGGHARGPGTPSLERLHAQLAVRPVS